MIIWLAIFSHQRRTCFLTVLAALCSFVSSGTPPTVDICAKAERECQQTPLMLVASGGRDTDWPIWQPLLAGLPNSTKMDGETSKLLTLFRRMGNFQQCTNDAANHMCVFERPELKFQLGVCLPVSCTATRYLQLVECRGIAKMCPREPFNDTHYQGYNAWCHDDHVSLLQALAPKNQRFISSALVVVICFASLVVVLCVMSFLPPRCQSLQELDVVSSAKSLVKSRPPGKLDFLDCFRVLAMLHIILGHTAIYTIEIAGNGNPAATSDGASLGALFILGAYSSVDTFFWLSGFLLAKGMLKALENMPGRPSAKKAFSIWLLGVIHRWIRLTPLYAAVLAYWINLAGFAVNGPLWKMFDTLNTVEYCKAHWWANLLYVSNMHAPNHSLFPTSDPSEAIQTCMGWTWYLTLDMQMHVVGSLLLVFYQFPRIRPVVVCILVASVIGSGVTAGLRSAAINAPFSMIVKSYMPLYSDIFCRASPFLIGTLTGIYWHHHQAAPQGWRLWACGLGGLSLLLLNLLLPWTNMPKTGLLEGSSMRWSQAVTNIWNALERPFYGLGLSGTVLAMSMLPANILRPLTWKGWIFLGRLTFGVYLWHIVVMWSTLFSAEDYIHFTFWTVLERWLVVAVGAHAASALTFMFVEAPSAKLGGNFLAWISGTKASKPRFNDGCMEKDTRISPVPLVHGVEEAAHTKQISASSADP